jgi:Family of unknown function (DUF6065)
MNWKVTRPNRPIPFEEGEPICMLVPQRRRELEAFAPAVIELQDAAKIDEHYKDWRDSRREFNAQLKPIVGDLADSRPSARRGLDDRAEAALG